MRDYVIFTDSSCDITPELLAEWEVPFVSLSYKFDEDAASHGNFDLPFPEFYDRMRKGSVARTAAANMDTFKQAFEPFLQEGKDILYIGFSSGLSTTVNSGAMAAKVSSTRIFRSGYSSMSSLAAMAPELTVVLRPEEKPM